MMKSVCIAAATTCLMAFAAPVALSQSSAVDMTTTRPAMQTVYISSQDFATTDRRVRAAIASRDLKLFAVVDHGEGARQTGLSLAPAKLYIFGNPKSGTPFMQAEPAFGLELPLKILVRETPSGEVVLTHPDIRALANAYGISGIEDVEKSISDTLSQIAQEAGAVRTERQRFEDPM